MRFTFENHTLDVDRRELRRGSELVAVEPQVFDLLLYLVQNRERVVSKDDLIAAVWDGRIVSDSTLTSRINAVRKAVGDSGEAQRLIRTIARKGIRFVAPIESSSISGPEAEPTTRQADAGLRQQIQFCTAADGVRLAYADIGSGIPLVRTGHWLTHLEFDWRSPVWSRFLHTLAASYRLIRYDARGNGLSDWDAAQLSFDTLVDDLARVVEATNPERFGLLGVSQGAAISIAYAVDHPDRVSHLILFGGFSRGSRRRGSPEQIEQTDALLTLMRHGWGQDNPAFRQIFSTRFMPEANPEQLHALDELQRKTTSTDNALRLRKLFDDIDVTELLPRVRTPTLVLHLRDDAAVPFEEGRRLAAAIPGARFVALEGRNHIMLENDPGWARFFEEIDAFLRT